jgi:hypothetical protein
LPQHFFFVSYESTYAIERAPLFGRLPASPAYIKPLGKTYQEQMLQLILPRHFFFITDESTYVMERAPLFGRLSASPTYIKPLGKAF